MSDRYASLKQGLVGCWIPSVSGSGLLLPDLSGRGYHGAFSNSTDILWTGVLGRKATSFSGADTGVLCAASPSHLQFSNSTVMSATAWVYTRSGDTLNAIASAVHQNANTNNFFWSIDVNSGGVGVALGKANVNANFVSMSRLDDQWQHIAMTFDTTKVSGWRNGVLQGSSTYTMGTVGVNDRQLWIGRDSNGSSRGFKGFVDDVRVYNRLLTESEIRLLAYEPGIGFKPAKKLSRFSQRFTYNPPKARNYGVVRVKETDYATLRQGLVGAWCPSLPNGGSGNTLPDVSGYNNHGSLVNMSPDDWVSSQYGRALDFDGTNDYLEYGRCDQLSGLSILSCSFWCYPKSANEMYGLIRYNTTIALGSERRADYFGIQATNGVLYPVCYFSLAGNVTFFQSFTSTSLPVAQNSWSHIAFSVNLAGNTATMAVNGVSVAGTRSSGGTPPTATAAQGTVTWRSQTYIGSGGTQFYFDGQIDDLRAYNRALSEPEIRLLASRPGIGLRQESHRQTFYQFPSFQPALARRSSAIIGGGIT